MITQVKLFLAAFILIPIIDFIWLGKVMSAYYMKEMGSLARVENGSIKPLLVPAIFVYILLALGLVVFVLPKAERWTQAMLFGALLGLITYGVYDLTCRSVINDYPLNLAFVDMAWGTFICGFVSTVIFFLREWLT